MLFLNTKSKRGKKEIKFYRILITTNLQRKCMNIKKQLNTKHIENVQ